MSTEHTLEPLGITIELGEFVEVTYEELQAIHKKTLKDHERLIDAAPDLLEALQDAYEILGISYPLTAPDNDKRSVVLSKARAAIDKATGEK